MTIDDLWEKYRIRCCLPDHESSELISWQRHAFYAAVTATVIILSDNPEGFEEFCASVLDWVRKEHAEVN